MSKKVAIVTGASGGIGEKIVELLAINNFQVIGVYNNSLNNMIETQKKLMNKNIEIDIFKADISKRSDVQNLTKFVLSKYNKIDVLINNAGISEFKLFTDVTDEDWDKIINTNLYSTFCVTQEAVKNMINNKSGCIINISSIWGLVGSSCESIYSISKAGIDAMTKSLAKELGPSNIRVNSIAPGFIDTKINSNLSSEDVENIKKETPLQKLGTPIDIAKCVLWLADDNFTTGQIISINGGWVIT